MNENTALSYGHENLLVLDTVALLRDRIRGGAHNVIFEDPHAPYLALCETGSWKVHPDELSTISIHEAILISTSSFLKRMKQKDILLTHTTLERMYDRVMLILNEKIGPIIAHPNETETITTRIAQLQSDSQTITSYLEQILDKYHATKDPQEQAIYGKAIENYFGIFCEESTSIQEISKIYSLPGDPYEGEPMQKPDFMSPNRTFLSVKVWTGDEDERGGLEDPVESEAIIEDIAFSEAENILFKLCPREFADIYEIFQENFSWSIVDTEGQRERSRDIKDYPNILEKKYRLMLRRKQIIYFYIKKILDLHRKQKQEGSFITATIKIRDMVRFLPILKHEIDEFMTRIRKISFPSSDKGDKEEDIQLPEDSQTQEIQDLLQRKTDAIRERNTYLTSFFYISESSEIFIPMIQMLNGQIKMLHEKIHDSAEARDNIDEAEGRESAVHIDKLFNDSQFFEKIPRIVEAPSTSIEYELINMYSLGEEISQFEEYNGMTLINTVYEADETDETEKMEHLLGIFEAVVSRKMFIYFKVFPRAPEDINHPVYEILDTLREEIEVVEMSKRILKRRVDWTTSDCFKGLDIIAEIEELWNRRFYQLKDYFTKQENASSRSDITEALTSTIQSLLERRQERDELEFEDGEPEDTLSMPEMTPEEQELLQYVPEEILKNDIIFRDSIPYHIYPDDTPLEQKKEKQRMLLTHICERLLIIYFFAQKNIDSIDSKMTSGADIDGQKAQTESQLRETTETTLEPMRQTIMDYLGNLGGYKKPEKTENSPPLYDKSIYIFSQLDGLQAHINDANKDLISECWSMIQNVVQLFSKEIYNNKIHEDNKTRPIQLKYRRKMKETLTNIAQELREKLPKEEAEGKINFMKKMIKKIDQTIFGSRALSRIK